MYESSIKILPIPVKIPDGRVFVKAGAIMTGCSS